MNEVRWTPGPWVKNRYGELVGRNGERVDVYDAGIRLTLASPDDVDRANAHLIAAAPELYEALEMIFDADGDCIKDDLPRQLPDHIRAKVGDILAKARGEL